MKLLTKILLALPLIGRMIKSSKGYLLANLQLLLNAKKYKECVELACYELSNETTATSDEFIWWEVMNMAVQCASKEQSKDDYVRLVKLVINRKIPSFKRSVAKTLTNLSMLGYFHHDVEGMIEVAKLASTADRDWGEPYFLLGWYHLPRKESIELFKKAVEKDSIYMDRIKTDSTCQKYPEIVAELIR